MIQAEASLTTHEVTNQPIRDPNRDPLADDSVLASHVVANNGDAGHLIGFGKALSGAWDLAAEARRDAPEAVIFDRHGRRRDEIRFSNSYHQLMALGLGHGYAALPWGGAAGGHTTHAAMVYLLSQVEPGVCCPMTMTYAGIPALTATGMTNWARKLATPDYDPSIAPLSAKRAATLGMAMTEKQGGSDVRANATRAKAEGDGWRLWGHKWFCSAPMSDGFLTLAQGPDGLTCYLVPRWLEDNTRNRVHLMRLKDKLGNTANASAEIEYHGAFAHQVGEAGQGVKAIIRMVHHTRLDTALAPAGLMGAALAEARAWAEGRTAFQRRLVDQPLMRAVLADLALDWEGALALGLRVARAFDEGDPLSRVAVALAKFLANKRAPVVIAEAMEVMGGMGYVEETPLPMLYREAPLNGIWEGSGNVICLDVLRTLARDEATREALWTVLRGSDLCRPALASLHARWPGLPPEAEARFYVERLACLLTVAVLEETAPEAVSATYVASRLGGDRGLVPGAVSEMEAGKLLERLPL